MYCKECGKEIQENSSFCEACGTTVKKIKASSSVIGLGSGNGMNQGASVSKPELSKFAKIEAAALMLLSFVSLIGMFLFPLIKAKHIFNDKEKSFNFFGFYKNVSEMMEYDSITSIAACVMIAGIIASLIITFIAVIKLRKGIGAGACKTLCKVPFSLAISQIAIIISTKHIISYEGLHSASVTFNAFLLVVLLIAAGIVGKIIAEDHVS